MLERLIPRGGSILLVAAHPDDETLAVGGILGHLRNVSVVHVTDGAPRDRRFHPRGLDLARERYAALRREEAAAALGLGGVTADRLDGLGAVDQEATRELPRLVRALVERMAGDAPTVVITHPYEGGHPDHDATALAVHAAVALVRRAGLRAPRIVEAASYHGAGGRFTPGQFLPAPDRTELVFDLSPADAARKRAMLDCFPSQREVIAAFPLGSERLREAPAHDFTRAPHEGPLFYEQLGWPTSGDAFREAARACLAALDLPASPCR